MLVCMRSPVEGFDIFCIHSDGRTRILDHLVPLAESVVAGGAIRVVDWVWFAEDRLAVEVDRLVVVFRSIRLVARSLQLPSEVVAFLSRVKMGFTKYLITHLC